MIDLEREAFRKQHEDFYRSPIFDDGPELEQYENMPGMTHAVEE